MIKNIKTIYAIFFVSVFVRVWTLVALLVYGGQNELLWGDSVRYQTLAKSLLSGLGYVYKGVPEAYRSPGYPLFFLISEWLHVAPWMMSLFQILCASMIPVCVYYLAQRFLSLSTRWSFVAALFCALEPVQVYYSVVLLPDVFFTLAILGVTLLLLQWFKDPYWRPMMWAGVLLGIANYIRPAGLYLAVAIVLAFSFYIWKKKLPYKKIWNLVLLVCMMLLVMLPWYVRNYVQFKEIGFVSAGAYNLYIYAAASTKAIAAGTIYDDVRKGLVAQIAVDAPDKDNRWSLANQGYLTSRSKEIIFSYPSAYVRSVALGLNTFLFSGNYHYLLYKYQIISIPERISFSLFLAQKGIAETFSKVLSLSATPYFFLAIVGKIVWIVFVLGSVVGLWFHRTQRLAFITLIYILYFSATIASVGIGVEARHRYVLNPLIFLFFIAMISHIYDRYIRRRASI